MPQKIIGFKGKNYVESKLTSKKLNIAEEDLEEIELYGKLDRLCRFIVDRKTGDVIKFDLRVGKIDKNSSQYDRRAVYNPLVLRKFGINRVTTKQLINLDKKFEQSLKKAIIINNMIDWNVPIRLKFVIEYYLQFSSSGNRWPKEEGEYLTLNWNMDESIAFDSYEEFLEYVLEEVISEHPKISRRLFDSEDCKVIYGNMHAISYNKAILGIDKDYGLFKRDPLKLTIFTNTIEFKDNCVKSILKTYYNKGGKGISSNVIDKIDDTNGVTIEQIIDFCKKYSIKTIAYDINKNVLAKYVPEKINKSYRALIYVAYNSHIYPITNKFLSETKEALYDSETYVKDIKNKLLSVLDDGFLPDDIKMSDNMVDGSMKIYSFVYKKKLYHSNSEYAEVRDVAKIYGIEDKIDPSINLSIISDQIEKLYTTRCTKSFFPYDLGFNGGYNYFNNDFVDETGDDLINVENSVTIDNNKHYTYALYMLDNLVSVDVRDAKITECSGKTVELVDMYIYIAKPEKSSILMPCNDYYLGYELKYCSDQGLKYEITHEIKTTHTSNYFKQLIDDARKKLSNNIFKEVMVRMIGRFNGCFGSKETIKFKKIVDNEEIKFSTGYINRLNEDYSVVFDTEEVAENIYNRRPIRHQVLFQARKIVYEKMKQLKIKSENLIKINTDAITFITKEKIISSKEFGEWKIEDKEVKAMYMTENAPNVDISIEIPPINEKNTIWMDYAGSGKTHYIINELIPSLKEKYLVVTPSHSACKDYKKNNINCSVIQKFTFNQSRKTPEKIIIVDEIGMVSKAGYDFLIRCALSGKIIYAFGDFNQLPPPCENKYYTENNKLLINMLFPIQKSLKTNYRNDFTTKYYDLLIHSKDNKYLSDEVKKYSSTDYKKSKAIICYTNETRKKYNDLMLKHLGIDKFDVGCRVVCKTNDLAEYEIYNNFYYTVTKNDGKWVELSDGVDEYCLELSDLTKYNSKSKCPNFDVGYARTVYNIQGESIRSYYYAPEDYKWLDGETAYTVISRLKTK